MNRLTARSIASSAILLIDPGHRRPGPTGRVPRSRRDLLKGFNARALGPYRAGSWVTSFAVPDAPARDHLYTLYVGTRNGGVWKTIEQRHDLRARLRRPAQALDRRRRRGLVRPERRLGRHGRALLRPELQLRRRRLEVGRRREDLDEHGPHGFAPYRPGRHPPDGPGRRLRRGHGPSVLRERRARRLQDDRRREELEKDALRRRPDRRRRPGPGQVGPGHALRGAVREGPPALDLQPRRSRERHLQDDGRGRHLGPARWRPADGPHRPHRARRLPEGPRTSSMPSSRTSIRGRRRPRRSSRTSAAASSRRRAPSATRSIASDDAGKTWRKVNAGYEAALDKAPYSFNQLRVDPADPQTVYITGQSLASTNDGGKTWKGLGWPSDGVMPRAFGDWRTACGSIPSTRTGSSSAPTAASTSRTTAAGRATTPTTCR